jgi:hypothetical protein
MIEITTIAELVEFSNVYRSGGWVFRGVSDKDY